MKIINRLADMPSDLKHSVVAIGNFDGVHRGHQALLKHAREMAADLGLPLLVLTFEPHPRQFFQSDIKPFRITPVSVKGDVFKTIINPDYYVAVDFDAALAGLSADDFINDILVTACHASVVVVGQNFHFGKGRVGTTDTLKQQSHFETFVFDMVHDGDETVSSSRVRECLQQADIAAANELLGWEWFIRGEVIHGDKRGRELGFPTANMRFGGGIVPSYGVYAVRARVEGETEWHIGAANIGTRPMFEIDEPLLETFIFDFNREIYGQLLNVQPVVKLRDEMRFNSLDDLIVQMNGDCERARKLLQK